MTERDLIHAAAYLLRLAHLSSEAQREAADHATAPIERGVIHSLMTGAILHAEAVRVPPAALSTPERLLAFTVASRVVRVLGGRTTPHAVRYSLVTVPRLAMPLPQWGALLRGAEEELDIAEVTPPATVDELLTARRDALALAHLLPTLEALAGGRPLPDTAERLRDVADAFDLATTSRPRLRAA